MADILDFNKPSLDREVEEEQIDIRANMKRSQPLLDQEKQMRRAYEEGYNDGYVAAWEYQSPKPADAWQASNTFARIRTAIMNILAGYESQ